MPATRTVGEFLTRLRTELKDDVEPYLWTDEDLTAYASWAQERFCRLTNGISDSSSSICRISVPASVESTRFSDRIKKVRLLMRDDLDGEKIPLLNFEDLEPHMLRELYRENSRPAAVLGMDEHTFRWMPKPSTDMVLQLTVWRLPLHPLEKPSDTFEIDDIHFEHLLQGASSRAYLKQDSETYDRGRSEQFGESFDFYCRQIAKGEQEKRQHKYRSVAYGGIPIDSRLRGYRYRTRY